MHGCALLALFLATFLNCWVDEKESKDCNVVQSAHKETGCALLALFLATFLNCWVDEKESKDCNVVQSAHKETDQNYAIVHLLKCGVYTCQASRYVEERRNNRQRSSGLFLRKKKKKKKKKKKRKKRSIYMLASSTTIRSTKQNKPKVKIEGKES